MNTLLLQPTDVLFFRDGRPMGGASAGHGAAWPLPTVTDAALHAALHRSSIPGHGHDQRRGPDRLSTDSRKFGSLVTAGPFPVSPQNTWLFPRPLDLTGDTLAPTLLPAALDDSSSLPAPLRYAVASTIAPSKDSGTKAWISAGTFQRYLDGDKSVALAVGDAMDDRDFSDAESTIGIGIDSDTQTQDGERIYSAHYLRLREGWRLGVFARTNEKEVQSPDLIPGLFRQPDQIIVGGQQRVCTARIDADFSKLPLPTGRTTGFTSRDGKCLVKWVLLSPAIWPAISDRDARGNEILDKHDQPITAHDGGWLPNWIRQHDGKVMLRSGERHSRRYTGRHSRGFSTSSEISAHLVAVIVPKPIVVTGWSLGTPGSESSAIGDSASAIRARPAGAKPTLLAVPAGAVYYFETDSPVEAQKLANALNWHGDPDAPDFGTTIKNRRSTLLGEKGFGLGVCGSWSNFGPKT